METTMNATTEMQNAKEELSTFLAAQPKRSERHFSTNVDYSAKVLHRDSPRLSEKTMNEELKNNGAMKSDEPRNFYDYTRNSDTISSFMGKHSMQNTGFYRNEFKGMDDPLAKNQVEIANDCAFRAMHTAHQQEKLGAEPEQIKALEKKHDFELNYFQHREAQDNPRLGEAQKQILEDKMSASYKDYKANKLGYNGVDRVYKNDETHLRTTEHTPLPGGKERQRDVTIRTTAERRDAIIQDKLPPKTQVVDVKQQSLSAIQSKMLAMRPKAQSQGRTM